MEIVPIAEPSYRRYLHQRYYDYLVHLLLVTKTNHLFCIMNYSLRGLNIFLAFGEIIVKIQLHPPMQCNAAMQKQLTSQKKDAQ